MNGYNWTTQEIAILREHYPVGGITACMARLQRTRSAIYQRVRELGIRSEGHKEGPRDRWQHDPEVDAQIRRLHETALVRGAIDAFAKRIGRPRWYVSKRARQMGLKTPRFREEPWSAAEIDLLHETSHIGTEAARLRFLKAGFRRSETAIEVKRKRERISIVQARQDAGMYTATQIAEMLGVGNKTPTLWIRYGELKATRRGTDRGDDQGGDQWTIRERDLREFIITHPMRVELRKIPDSNRAWFIELLAGRAGIAAERVA